MVLAKSLRPFGNDVRAEEPGSKMKVLLIVDIVRLIGEPDMRGKGEGVASRVVSWNCGCRAYPESSPAGYEDEAVHEEWVQCAAHLNLGEGPLRRAAVRFGFDEMLEPSSQPAGEN